MVVAARCVVRPASNQSSPLDSRTPSADYIIFRRIVGGPLYGLEWDMSSSLVWIHASNTKPPKLSATEQSQVRAHARKQTCQRDKKQALLGRSSSEVYLPSSLHILIVG